MGDEIEMQKRKIMWAVRLIFVAIFLMPSWGWGATWYCRPVGAEYGAEDGTTYATAYDGPGDITWGVGGVVAGDTLYMCGVHVAYFNVGASGSTGNPITIRFDYPGDPGSNEVAGGTAHAIRMSGVNYITIIGDSTYVGGVLSGGTTNGVGVISAGTNIKLQYLTLKDNTVNGVQFAGANGEISYCKIYGNDQKGISSGAANNLWVHHNSVHDNGTVGENNHDGIFVGSISTGVIVEYNDVYNQLGNQGTGIDFSGSAGGSSTATVRYNKIYNGAGNGMSASGEAGNTDTLTAYSNLIYGNASNFRGYETVIEVLYNNTFGSATSIGVLFLAGAGAQTVTFKNNIIKGTFPYAISTDPTNVTLTSDYNCIQGGTTATTSYDGANNTWAQWQVSTSGDAHSINSDPLFVSATDFHLLAGNPCIDTGTATGLGANFLDLDGIAMTDGAGNALGAGVDIGCYNFAGHGANGPSQGGMGLGVENIDPLEILGFRYAALDLYAFRGHSHFNR